MNDVKCHEKVTLCLALFRPVILLQKNNRSSLPLPAMLEYLLVSKFPFSN